MREQHSRIEKGEMDTLTNLKTFLQVAESAGFSAAGRKMELATSVITKRIDQLEMMIGAQLFTRSTRSLVLTDAGQNWLGRVRALVADVDDVLGAVGPNEDKLQGPLRVKLPTTLTMLYFGDIIAKFQQNHPSTTLEVILTDRALNPLDEGFDIAVAAFGTSYSGVTDIPLCPLRRVLCAAPEYVARSPECVHPRDLQSHAILSFQPTGNIWAFEGVEGPVQVSILPRLSANEGQVLLASALAGNGIALLSEYLALPALQSGELVPVMGGYKPVEIWLKALVPTTRLHVSRVIRLLDVFREEFAIDPPWLRASKNLADISIIRG